MNGAHTFLLVEDDPNDVTLIRRAFRKCGIATALQVVSDGDAAIAYLSGQGAFADRDQYPLPVLVLLDLKLPRTSGLEVLAWRREQEGLRRIPVVVLTSSRLAPDVNSAYDLGANSYLVKPVSPEGLQEIVRALNLYWLALNEKPEVLP